MAPDQMLCERRGAAGLVGLDRPNAPAIASEQMRWGRDLDFAEAMRAEFRIVLRAVQELEVP